MPAAPPPRVLPVPARLSQRRARRALRSAPAALLAALVGVLLAGGASYATSWISGHTGRAAVAPLPAPVTNLTLRAVAAPTPFPASLLYPGASGDVSATITNPNPFPVTITAVNLASDTTYAAGYTDPSLDTPRLDCSGATPSGVTWAHATSTTGSTHSLASPITVWPPRASSRSPSLTPRRWPWPLPPAARTPTS